MLDPRDRPDAVHPGNVAALRRRREQRQGRGPAQRLRRHGRGGVGLPLRRGGPPRVAAAGLTTAYLSRFNHSDAYASRPSSSLAHEWRRSGLAEARGLTSISGPAARSSASWRHLPAAGEGRGDQPSDPRHDDHQPTAARRRARARNGVAQKRISPSTATCIQNGRGSVRSGRARQTRSVGAPRHGDVAHRRGRLARSPSSAHSSVTAFYGSCLRAITRTSAERPLLAATAQTVTLAIVVGALLIGFVVVVVREVVVTMGAAAPVTEAVPPAVRGVLDRARGGVFAVGLGTEPRRQASTERVRSAVGLAYVVTYGSRAGSRSSCASCAWAGVDPAPPPARRGVPGRLGRRRDCVPCRIGRTTNDAAALRPLTAVAARSGRVGAGPRRRRGAPHRSRRRR